MTTLIRRYRTGLITLSSMEKLRVLCDFNKEGQTFQDVRLSLLQVISNWYVKC